MINAEYNPWSLKLLYIEIIVNLILKLNIQESKPCVARCPRVKI